MVKSDVFPRLFARRRPASDETSADRMSRAKTGHAAPPIAPWACMRTGREGASFRDGDICDVKTDWFPSP